MRFAVLFVAVLLCSCALPPSRDEVAAARMSLEQRELACRAALAEEPGACGSLMPGSVVVPASPIMANPWGCNQAKERVQTFCY